MKHLFKNTKKNLSMAVLLLGLSMPTMAQLFVYDGFDAPAGQSINTTSSGTGWTSAWFEIGGALGNSYSNSSPLGYLTLQETGNYIGTTNYSERTSRSFSVPGILDNGSGYLGKSGTTVYMSFLYRKDQDAANWYANGPVVQLINYNEDIFNYDNIINKLGVGSFENKKVLQIATGNANSNRFDGSATFNYGDIIFVVVKYTFNASTTTVDVFQNPDDAQSEPGVPSFSQTYNQVFSFNGVYFALGTSSNSGALDEIRLGQTWEDVTPTESVVSIDGVNILPSAAINTNGGNSVIASEVSPASGTGSLFYNWSVSNPDGLYLPVVNSPTISGFGVRNGTYTLTLSVTGPLNTVVQTSTITVSNQTINDQLLAYEGFDYPLNSTLTGLNNTFLGWNGGWLTQAALPADVIIINSTTMGYGGLSITGNYLNRGDGFGGTNRRLNLSQNGGFSQYLQQDGNLGRKGKTIYSSFLLRRIDNSDMQFIFSTQTDGIFADYIGTQAPKFGIKVQNGLGSKILSIRNGNSADVNSTRIINQDSTYFIVSSLTYSSNGDTLRLYVNPKLGMPLDPTTAVVQAIANVTANTAFSSISYMTTGTNSYDIDEIRFGTTYASVSPFTLIALQSATISGSSSLIVGGNATYNVDGYLPTNASTPVSTIWYSSNTSVATIDGTSGALTALAAGITDIFAVHNNPAMVSITSNGISLTVTSAPIALVSATISGASTLTVGGMNMYNVDGYLPTNASTPVSTIWYSSNTSVATIDGASGVLTALSAGSTNVFAVHNNPAMVSITSNGISLTVTTVPTNVLPIALVSATILGANALTIGGMATYSVLGYNPTDATTPVSTMWYSSNTAVATIDGATGVLTALSAGSTNVFAMNNNPAMVLITSNGISLTVTTVPSPPTKIATFVSASEILLFPNPAHNVVFVTIPSNMDVSVFDLVGKKLSIQAPLRAGVNEIAVNEFQSGIYFLKFTDGINQVVKKLIIK